MKKDIIKLKVRKERIGPILGRHPWVFSGALVSIPEKLETGSPVHVVDDKGNFLAAGYFNSYSQIAVRIWSYDENEKVDEDFFSRRIGNAYEMRRKYVESASTDAFRVVNSENDQLPGLIVDKYAGYLAVQFHTKGIEAWKEEIVKALQSALSPRGIFEKSDAAYRRKEGLEKQAAVILGEVPDEIAVKENGIKFLVDMKGGQKTGFFLDQRDKRKALQKYVQGKKVLNCFSYTGGFSAYALAAGAEKVVSVDASEPAIEFAKKNIALNGLDESKCEFVVGDVKEYLRNLKGGEFDVIVLDPPAFIKDRHKKKEGIAGYRGINEAAMRLLPQAGILATCSCSAHLSPEEFRYVISEAGGRAKRTLKILEAFTHGIDHPSLVPFTEGEYLKCLFIEAN